MKRILTTVTALALLSGPVMADPDAPGRAGCNVKSWPASILDRHLENGKWVTCPPTKAEHKFGDVLFLGGAAVITHGMTGGSFPLFAGGL